MIDLDDFRQLSGSLGHSRGDKVLIAAARALADLARQDVRVFEQLVDTVRGGQGMFCFSAAAGLIGVGERALAPLLEALGDEQYIVRQASCFALGDLGDRRAVETLIGRLADASDAVRQSAAVLRYWR